jgi:hypothetical protein
MSSLCSTIQNKYINKIPTELPNKAVQSFVVTGVICLISGTSAVVALLGGSIALLASTIEALTRPIIKSIFPNNHFIGYAIQIIFPPMAALGLVSLAAPGIGFSYKITGILLPVLAWISLNNSNWYGENRAMVSVV